MLKIISNIYNQLTSLYSFDSNNAKKIILILDILYYINNEKSMFQEDKNIDNTKKIHTLISEILAEPESLTRNIPRNKDSIVNFFLKIYNPLNNDEREVFKHFWNGNT